MGEKGREREGEEEGRGGEGKDLLWPTKPKILTVRIFMKIVY